MRLREREDFITTQLAEQGIAVESLLPLADVKAKFRELSQQYDEGDSSLEGEVEKWSKLLGAHPEYKQELEQEAIEWAASQEAPCAQAYEVTRSFLPVDLHRWTKEELVHAGLPEKLAARIFKHTVLRLLLKHPEEIARLHGADLANVYSITGCDIVELRAVFFALLPVTFENDADGKKAEWKISVRRKLRAMTKTEERSQLMRNEVRHPAYQKLQSADGRGPLDPRAPLLQSKGAVKSNAFDPIENCLLYTSPSPRD